jgi:dolichol-phosphate mannosyltransferase
MTEPAAVEISGKAGLDKLFEILSRLRLAEKVTTEEGVTYRVTDAGIQFLEEYEDVRGSPRDSVREQLLTETDRIITRVVKNQVTVVLPVLNEAEAIPSVIDEIRAEGYENMLIVDGYSTDKTTETAHANGVRVIYQHGIGKAGAVKTAIESVKTPYTLFMDGDHTYDPKDIWRLLNHADHYAHVIGARDKRHIPSLHRLGDWVISQVFSMLFGVKVSDVCSGMYLLETEEARKYKLEEPGFIVEIELATHSASSDTLTEVPISYRPRVGTGKLTAWDGFGILAAAFTLASRYNPVLLYSGLAGLSIIPGTIILGWLALQWLTSGIWHSGWVILGVTLMLVAAQAFTLATVSILTKHSEERLLREIRRRRTTS